LIPSPNTKKIHFTGDHLHLKGMKQKEVGTFDPTSSQKENIFLIRVFL